MAKRTTKTEQAQLDLGAEEKKVVKPSKVEAPKKEIQKETKPQVLNIETTTNDGKLSQFSGLSKEEVAVLKKTVAKGVTDVELAYFLSVSKSNGLDPFNKEVWCYKDGKGNLLVFTGRDGFLKKAQENPTFNGIRSSEVRENDKFEIDIPNAKVEHKITKMSVKDRGPIIGAYCFVFRKDGEATLEAVDFDTYSKGYGVWKSHPAEMVRKVAECHALKKAFGLSGIQSEHEFDVKNNVVLPVETEKGSLVKYMVKKIENCENTEQLKQINEDLKDNEPQLMQDKDVVNALMTKFNEFEK